MKRKALVILTVAILAFAMIPALGTQAGEGDVKLVTATELGDPAPEGGDSRFVGLNSLDYVTDAVIDRDLPDTRGTLYVVVEDNDADSNAHTNITGTFTYTGSDDASGNVSFHFATGTTTPTAIYNPIVVGALDDISIADRNRDGRLNGLDVTITRLDDEGARLGGVFETQIVFIEGAEVLVRAGAFGPDVQSVRIEVATATENALTDDSGSALITVRSGSGNDIKVHAGEKNLSAIDAAVSGDAGASVATVEASTSRDSGLFVGVFGIIRSEWKNMLEEWLSDVDTGNTQTPNPVTRDADLSKGDAVQPVDVNMPFENIEIVTVPDSSPAETFQRLTQPIVLDPVLPPGCVCIVDSNADGVINHQDFRVEYNRVRGSTGVLKSWSYAADPTSGNVTLTVVVDGLTTQPVSDDPATTDTNEAEAGDTFRIRYSTEQTIGTLINAQIDTRGDGSTSPQDLHNAFDDLSDDDGTTSEGDDAEALSKTLTQQADNLGLDPDDDGASLLINKLVGVSDGDTLEVRYEDPSRGEGTQRARAEVDLTPPTIGNVDPANNSFTTDDDFDATFTVTDSGSGIYEDAETLDIGPAKYVDAMIETRAGGAGFGGLVNLSPEEDDDVSNGYLYEATIDVGDEAGAAEDDDLNLDIRLTITAFDIAGNKKTSTVIITVDTIEPELLAAFTGWGITSKSGVDRKEPTDNLGAYVLVENARDWVALVFNGAVAGGSIRASDIAVAGHTVTDVVWLDGSGGNVLSIGKIGESETATDIDFNKKTVTGNRAADVVTSAEPGGFGLDNDALNQNPNYILFLQLDSDLDTDARPSIQIDGEDLSDLAGNENGDDHSLARANDGLAPVFTVTVTKKLSNDTLNIDIVTTEELDRRPSATIRLMGSDDKVNLDVDDETPSSWSVSENKTSLGLTRRDGDQDGVWNIAIQGTDEAGNTSGASVAKWEFDTLANDGKDPIRGGAATATAALKIEQENIIFLSLTFDHEADEYDDQTAATNARGKDSSASISVTALTLETLDADDAVATTEELELAIVQTSDNKRFVIALSDTPIGKHRIKVDYADTPGNTGEYEFNFEIVAPQPEVIPVSPGWSLISIPGTPQSKSIASVLEGSQVMELWSLNNESKVWEYSRKDPDTGEFGGGTLTQIVGGRAYFVRSTTFDPIKVLIERFDPKRTPPQYNVTTGWNSIGYTPAGQENEVAVDAYLSALGTTGWGMIRMWNDKETPPRYETYYSSGTATSGFPTNDDGVAVVEYGRGYLLFATRNGAIGG